MLNAQGVAKRNANARRRRQKKTRKEKRNATVDAPRKCDTQLSRERFHAYCLAHIDEPGVSDIMTACSIWGEDEDGVCDRDKCTDVDLDCISRAQDESPLFPKGLLGDEEGVDEEEDSDDGRTTGEVRMQRVPLQETSHLKLFLACTATVCHEGVDKDDETKEPLRYGFISPSYDRKQVASKSFHVPLFPGEVDAIVNEPMTHCGNCPELHNACSTRRAIYIDSVEPRFRSAVPWAKHTRLTDREMMMCIEHARGKPASFYCNPLGVQSTVDGAERAGACRAIPTYRRWRPKEWVLSAWRSVPPSQREAIARNVPLVMVTGKTRAELGVDRKMFEQFGELGERWLEGVDEATLEYFVTCFEENYGLEGEGCDVYRHALTGVVPLMWYCGVVGEAAARCETFEETCAGFDVDIVCVGQRATKQRDLVARVVHALLPEVVPSVWLAAAEVIMSMRLLSAVNGGTDKYTTQLLGGGYCVLKRKEQREPVEQEVPTQEDDDADDANAVDGRAQHSSMSHNDILNQVD